MVGTMSIGDFTPGVFPGKIKPLRVKELTVDKYYTQILTEKLVRITAIDDQVVCWITSDKDGDIVHDHAMTKNAEGMFYEAYYIEQ